MPLRLSRSRRATASAEIVLALTPLVAGSAVGAITNARGRGWYRTLSKPRWTPPDAVFGPVWTVLYLTQGVAAVLVARRRPRRLALGLFAAQLVLNLAWSVLFFGRRRADVALLDLSALWVALLATVVAFARLRVGAALLLLPYLAWTTFAGALNVSIAVRNPRS